MPSGIKKNKQSTTVTRDPVTGKFKKAISTSQRPRPSKAPQPTGTAAQQQNDKGDSTHVQEECRQIDWKAVYQRTYQTQLKEREYTENLIKTCNELKSYNNALKQEVRGLEARRDYLTTREREVTQELRKTIDTNTQEKLEIEAAGRSIYESFRQMVVQRDELAERLDKLSAFESLEGRDCFPNWSKLLEGEVKTAWNGRLGSRYRRVKVLLVQWVSDDLNVGPELDWLRQIFEYAYEYEVSRFSIPDLQPSIALSAELAKFMGDHNPDTLLIFYYSGHGMIDPERNLSYWAANNTDNSPSMPTGFVQTLLEESRSDALLLYDSCCSADTAMTKTSVHGITELIAACGFESSTYTGPTSFTNALSECLRTAYFAGRQFSVSELYSQILSKLRNAPGRTMEVTPVHCTLTSEKIGRHIMLGPPCSMHQLVAAAPDPIAVQNVITVSFGLNDPAPDMQSWRNWILKAPAEAGQLLLARRAVGPCYVLTSSETDEGYGSAANSPAAP